MCYLKIAGKLIIVVNCRTSLLHKNVTSFLIFSPGGDRVLFLILTLTIVAFKVKGRLLLKNIDFLLTYTKLIFFFDQNPDNI